MNQYLLLRDNKQTGPYTVEELAAKGLKAYDLVWLEGKSAAWRYPSEIAELKPYAPVVEEQPYDRFYKKPVQETHAQLAQAEKTAWQKAESVKQESYQPPLAREEEPEIPEQEEPAVHPKKIYVTMPGGKRPTADKKEPVKKAASFSQSINAIAEERPVQAPVKKKDEPLPAVPANESYSPSYELPAEDLYTQMQSAAKERTQTRKKTSVRPIMLGLVAACLLLVGVIIGLYISGANDKTQQKALEDLVKQIQERDQKRNSAQALSTETTPVQNAQENIPDSNTNVLNGHDKTIEEKLPVSTVSRKTPLNGSKDNNVLPASNPQQVEPVAANTAVLEEANKEKVTYQQAAIDAARKNIHQMIGLENSKFKTGVLGGISNLYMTLSNNSRFPLDQVEIEIKYFGPEQKLVKTQTLLFNDLAPGEQKTLEAPRTNRGVTIDYTITRVQSKVLGLAHNQN